MIFIFSLFLAAYDDGDLHGCCAEGGAILGAWQNTTNTIGVTKQYN